MKKSKFLLLGSVASLASIPFVAAKCGETKEEEEKKNLKLDQKPGGDKNPGENMKIQTSASKARWRSKTKTRKIHNWWKIKNHRK